MNEIDPLASLIESLRNSLAPHADDLLALCDQSRAMIQSASADNLMNDMRSTRAKMFSVLKHCQGDGPALPDDRLAFVLQAAWVLRSAIAAEATRRDGLS